MRMVLQVIVGASIAGGCALDRDGTLAANDDAGFGGSAGAGNTAGMLDSGNGGSAGSGGTSTGGVAGSSGSGGSAGSGGTDAGQDSAGGSAGADAGPLSPLDIPGLVLWLRADVGVQLTGADVAGWQDQSGKGNHYVQPTPGNQPDFQAAGVNGKPSVHFFAKPGQPEFLQGPSLPLGGVTVLIIAKLESAPIQGGAYLELFGNTSASPSGLLRVGFSGASAHKDMYFGPGNPGLVRTEVALDTAPHLYEIAWDGTAGGNPSSYSFTSNGTPVVPLPANGGTPPTLSAIGTYTSSSANVAFYGHVSEFIVYDHAINPVDRAQLAATVRAFWGI